MSRIGNRKLSIPTGVTASLNGNVLTVKGAKGELTLTVDELIDVQISENEIETIRKNSSKRANVVQGTTNSLINNMLIGVSNGYEKGLEAVGVGYRFNVAGNKLTINAGYSHPVVMEAPAGITITGVSNTEITIAGIDKQKVTEFAAKVREVREPEPYKGKGIRYKGEHVRRKEGKKAAK
ncbi:MAG: 50S ribosomal protein L6 [Bacilli bacterium]|nr:50S ribosomal protein L6 [Bacilli bacterium]